MKAGATPPNVPQGGGAPQGFAPQAIAQFRQRMGGAPQQPQAPAAQAPSSLVTRQAPGQFGGTPPPGQFAHAQQAMAQARMQPTRPMPQTPQSMAARNVAQQGAVGGNVNQQLAAQQATPQGARSGKSGPIPPQFAGQVSRQLRMPQSQPAAPTYQENLA